jgi:hypothetical protein
MSFHEIVPISDEVRRAIVILEDVVAKGPTLGRMREGSPRIFVSILPGALACTANWYSGERS